MDESENSYRKIVMDSGKKSSGFGKGVIVPFVSGVLGASLVVGTCFGVPSVREKLLGSSSSNVVSTSTQNTITSTSASIVSLADFSDTAIGVAEKTQPSVVGITVEYNINSIFSLMGSSTGSASGSGVIISEDGYILTNNHIVNTSSNSSYYSLSEATKVTVNLYGDDTEYEAKIIGTDEETDLAIIKIEKTGLTAATLGNSNDLKVGEYVMAVGNPLGMQNSVTGGIVSAVNREITDDDGTKYVLIQTDAAINSGNSGGALVNSKGEVIGINTLKLYGTGIEGMGFAIPISSTLEITEQLIQYGKVKRPYIGIEGIDVNEQTSQRTGYPIGVYVKTINDFSAGQKAGLKAGDVIIAADGKEVKSMSELNSIKNSHKIGEEMTVKVYRDGNEVDITILLEEQK